MSKDKLQKMEPRGNKNPSPAFTEDGFFCTRCVLEAPAGFEPAIKVLQTYALPLGYSAGYGADYEARTRYLHLGKVALYQMS